MSWLDSSFIKSGFNFPRPMVPPDALPSAFETSADYQFIDLVPVLDLGLGEGLFSHFQRTVSRSFAGWQIGVKDAAGVYELLLKQHGSSSSSSPLSNSNRFSRTDFLLKYYPSPGEKDFETFSLYEKILRTSPAFDGKPAPDEKLKQEMHESYFTVGEIALVLAHEGSAAGLCLVSQDEWREQRVKALSVRDASGKIHRLPAGSHDRRVPGWKISRVFFDCLIKAYSLRYGAPQTIRLFEFKGRIWKIDGKKIQSRLNERTREKKFDIVFDRDKKRRGDDDTDLRRCLAQISAGKKILKSQKLADLESLFRVLS